MKFETATGDSAFQFTAENDGLRLDSWLSGKLSGVSRSYVQKLIEDGKVTVDGKNIKANYRLKTGDRVSVYIPPPEKLDVAAEEIKLEILHEDGDIIVINKPKGMVVHPGRGKLQRNAGKCVNASLRGFSFRYKRSDKAGNRTPD